MWSDRTLTLVIAAVSSAGVIVGGSRSAPNPSEPGASAPTRWVRLPEPADPAVSQAEFVDTLDQLLLFTSPDSRTSPPKLTAVTIDPGQTEFPSILAVAELDGEAVAILDGGAAGAVSLRAGEMFNDEWLIETITTNELVASLDGETETFLVVGARLD